MTVGRDRGFAAVEARAVYFPLLQTCSPILCRQVFTKNSLDQHTGAFNDGQIGPDSGELDVALAQAKRDNQQPQSYRQALDRHIFPRALQGGFHGTR